MSHTEQMREAFKAWADKNQHDTTTTNAGQFASAATGALWSCWKAALTAPAAEPEQSTRLRGGVPDGWSITRKDDGRIVVKAPSGDAWAWQDEHATGTSNDFVYAFLSALTAAPQAPALDAGVVRDAERYRWIAAHCRSTAEHWGGRWSIVVEGPEPKTHDSEDDFDAAIDAAMSAQGGGK